MKSKKNIAYDYLKENILSNKLKGNQAISEMAIAKKLDISRSPLREAMRQLEQEGLIVSYPDRGSFVTALTPYDVEEIYDLRTILELWGLEKSINRISDSELDELAADLLLAAEKDDWEELHQVDRRLHSLIITRSGSKRLVSFINTLNSQTERVRRISTGAQMRRENSVHEHLEIINCIRCRDLEAAKAALKKHITSVGGSAIEVTMNQTI